MPRTLDCHGQSPLVLGASARLATWPNLAPIADKALKQANILKVDAVIALSAELADLRPCCKATPVVSSVIAHSDNLLELPCICGVHLVVVGVIGTLIAIEEDELLSHQLGPIMALAIRAFPAPRLESTLNIDL